MISAIEACVSVNAMVVVFSSGSWSVASYCARRLFEGRIVKAWFTKYKNRPRTVRNAYFSE